MQKLILILLSHRGQKAELKWVTEIFYLPTNSYPSLSELGLM